MNKVEICESCKSSNTREEYEQSMDPYILCLDCGHINNSYFFR